MRIQSRKALPAAQTRDERLRESRASAQTLRVAAPGTAWVEVQLRFLPEAEPLAAAQSFVLYPAALAFFAYPCPHGDCDGIYDLEAEARRILNGEKASVTGTVECAGLRSCRDLSRQHCGQRVNYTISTQLRSDEPPSSQQR